MTDTGELLRRYEETGSEQAFAELVQRHVDLVYSTALRKVRGDAHLAQDIAQMVFADFARKARALPADVVLGGWLYRHTCFKAGQTLREEINRRVREQKAVEMNALNDDSDATWKDLAPLLDDAMERLGTRDRDAIVLRFFEGRDLRTVGAMLGVNDDAAQKRVSRAVERLRAFFAKRGVTVGASGLVVVLSANAVQAAPAGLAATLTSASLASVAPATGSMLTLVKFMALLGAIAIPVTVWQVKEVRSRIGSAPQAGVEDGGTWHRRASGPAQSGPFARIGHSVIWTGKEMIIWGGGSQSVFFNDGGRYDLATDTWHPISLLNAPSPRWFHAAVWTGTEMIVWGGRAEFDNFEIKDDGARYNPSTDTWTPLAAKEAPTARSQMAAVWTGREMLIWGGTGEEWVIERRGARYNPQADTWQPLAEKDAPEPRMEPSAVWTGSEMIIWGGIRYSPDQITFNTGGRYDPARDLWISLPTNGVPEARTGHTAVWTGIEMIVWGGHEDTQFMDTGARFSIASNTWTPTTMAKAPQRRMGHCAVWTGSEMVIWGGQTGQPSLDDMTWTGARYNPLEDEWRRVTNIGAPAARIFQRDDGAVWTSKGMIIFGGGTGRNEFDSNYFWTPPPGARIATDKFSNYRSPPAPGGDVAKK